MDREGLVAEVRSGLYHRLDDPELIDLGTWQIALVRAINKFIEKPRRLSADNDALCSSTRTAD